MPALIFSGGARGQHGGNSSTDPGSVSAGKDPRRPGNHVFVFNGLFITKGKSSVTFSSPFCAQLINRRISLAGWRVCASRGLLNKPPFFSPV